MSAQLSELFDILWRDYLVVTPQASLVHELLAERGETIVNDHIALRTFGHPRCDLHVLDRFFVASGYEPIENYEFPEKKLTATHYEHPSGRYPKVFISALLLEECSASLRESVHGLIEQLPAGLESQWNFAASGRQWQLDHGLYSSLEVESPYAAWLAAFGFRANHFTVAVHRLEKLGTLEALSEVLVGAGIPMNHSGGLIKGGPEVGLEQCATQAETIEVAFSDGPAMVPSCYYEFARRHSGADGKLFQGFIAGSASKLFESTHRLDRD